MAPSTWKLIAQRNCCRTHKPSCCAPDAAECQVLGDVSKCVVNDQRFHLVPCQGLGQ